VDQSAIVAKFIGNATRRLDAATAEQLMEIILNIDAMSDTGDLAGVLA
jgi:hypothetical protein